MPGRAALTRWTEQASRSQLVVPQALVEMRLALARLVLTPVRRIGREPQTARLRVPLVRSRRSQVTLESPKMLPQAAPEQTVWEWV